MSAIAAREHPILFRPELVRKILDGQKTQTRRVVRQAVPPEKFQASAVFGMFGCPYGLAGDRLWVRETWRYEAHNGKNVVVYRADDDPCDCCTWRPSIFMPRAVCRLVLEVLKTRLQRLQEITEVDAKAEGVDAALKPLNDDPNPPVCESYVWGFHHGWNSINEKRGSGWAVNPWVWVIEFKIHTVIPPRFDS